jgi:hypothetical protein
MAANGEASIEDIKKAMIDRTGPVYEQAVSTQSQQQGVKYLLSSMFADFYPDGEHTQRELQKKYYNMIDQAEKGNKEPINKFFDEHPEYEVRQLALTSDPEARLKKYLTSTVWDRYMSSNKLQRRSYREEFGDLFLDAFLTKETQDYDAIPLETMAYWAQQMGAELPESVKVAQGTQIKQIPASVNEAYNAFEARIAEKYPNLSELLNQYYALDEAGQEQMRSQYPEIDAYYNERNRFLADNPEAIPYITSEQSNLYGLPVDIQQAVYEYRAQKAERYPDIEQTQKWYFALTEEQRKAYRKAHPELVQYWTWRREYAAAHPTAAAYILSEETLAKAIAAKTPTPQPTTHPAAGQMGTQATLTTLAATLAAGQITIQTPHACPI